MAMLTVKVKITDTDLFYKLLDLLRELINDPTIPEETKQVYKDKLQTIVNEGCDVNES